MWCDWKNDTTKVTCIPWPCIPDSIAGGVNFFYFQIFYEVTIFKFLFHVDLLTHHFFGPKSQVWFLAASIFLFCGFNFFFHMILQLIISSSVIISLPHFPTFTPILQTTINFSSIFQLKFFSVTNFFTCFPYQFL